MPDLDMREALLKEDIPLYGLESFSPLNSFSLLGITLQHELNYPNIPEILTLSSIPLRAIERVEDSPFVVMGGPLAVNPMPLSILGDLFVVGDGEEVVIKLLEIAASSLSRKEKLQLFSEIEGVFVPSITNKPKSFRKARVARLKNDYYPIKQLVPLIETVHLRGSVEVMRGCSRGCRFCAAGYYYRPVREKEGIEVAHEIESLVVKEGWRTVSLLSLSTADYTALPYVLDKCYAQTEERMGQLSLPSTRLDKATAELFGRMDLSRRSGITFAPEAGSERLRQVINKNITEEEIVENIGIALRHGYQVIKLYFMIGLPTESDEDINAMVKLIDRIWAVFREFKGGRRISLHISISPFAPKAGTPFEREALISKDIWDARMERIKKGVFLICGNRIDVSWGNQFIASLETLFARGGEELGNLLIGAAEKGLLLQSWNEHFNESAWLDICAKYGVNLYNHIQEISGNAILPWEPLRTNIESNFFKLEREKAYNALPTDDCRYGCSNNCDNCTGEVVSHFLATETHEVPDSTMSKIRTRKEPDTFLPVYYYASIYAKLEKGRFIPHRDMVRLMERAFRVANLPLRYSFGFSAHPEMSFTYPLPLGVIGERERMTFITNEPLSDCREALNAINNSLPSGLKMVDIRRLNKRISIDKSIISARYSFQLGKYYDECLENFQLFLKKKELIVSVKSKSGERMVNIRPLLGDYTIIEGNSIEAVLSMEGGNQLRPSDFLKHALCLAEREALSIAVSRKCFLPE